MAKILIIDDEAAIRDEVMDWLVFEGHEVLGAANGRSGLALIHEHTPDLILCDIAMPELDGREVLIEVRATPHLSQTPFIFLTAAADRESIRKGMSMGADDYLTKPFTHAEVLAAVNARLSRKAQQAALLQAQIKTLDAALSEDQENHLLKSHLVAMFAHDFRNPISAILAFSSLLRSYDQRLTLEKKQRYLDRIDGSAKLLLQMLDEMMTLAEMESGHLECIPNPVDLTHFINDLVEEFSLIDGGAHCFTFHSAVAGFCEVDKKLLRQILVNLISNAMKYSPQKSEISIRLDQTDADLLFEVRDQGIGISAEDLPRLFDPYFRATNAKTLKGTGLGLPIVQECVALHGGQIAVESRLDEGSRFVVTLPKNALPKNALPKNALPKNALPKQHPL